jgi:hypothetical protein
MTSSPQKLKLENWKFFSQEYYPNSYNEYEQLLSTNNSRYEQDDKNNKINLKYVFDNAIKQSGFSNTIIDVDASNAKGEIVKAKKFSGISEVVLVSKLKNGKKGLIGLFRGSCGGSDKKGVINFSLFASFSGNIQKCIPGSNQDSQIAYFHPEFFEAYKRAKGITDSILSKILSEYSESNPLNYIFYCGNLTTNGDGDAIYKDGVGTMFRKLSY